MENEALISKNLSIIKSKLKNETLIAVSKSVGIKEIEAASKAGQVDFGENRVMDLLEKSNQLIHLKLRWHFIGTLQRNKVKKLLLVKNLFYIHSVDSLALLEELLKNKGEVTNPIGLFLQCNTSGEEEKHGFEGIEELLIAARKIRDQGGPEFFLKGLMTIGKIRSLDFEKDALNSFRKLKEYKKVLEKENFQISLSMGMSQDFEIALKEGTDFLRIGSFIFNP